MKMLPRTVVEEVKACHGIYRMSDVARHYGIDKSTVKRIWDGERRQDIAAAADFPDIQVRPHTADLRDDIVCLLVRGLGVKDIASTVGLSPASIYAVKAGVTL